MSDHITEWQFVVKDEASQPLGKISGAASQLDRIFNGISSALSGITSVLTDINGKMNSVVTNGSKSFQQLSDISSHTSEGMNAAFASMRRLDDVLKNTGDIARNTGKQLEQNVDKKLTETGKNNGPEKAKKKVRELGDEAKKSGGKIKTNLLDNLAKFGQVAFGLKSAIQGVGAAIVPIFEEGMARQTATVNFTTLLRTDGDTKETAEKRGKEFADALRTSTAAALYGTSTVNDAAKNMLSMGLDSGKTQTVLKQIGDIAAGDAQKFGSLSLAFAQISSAGKLGGQDLMQLINAGFNPLAEMSKKTGKSIGALKEEMSKGTITAKMVEEAFAAATAEGGQFHGMLDDIKNNTLQGQLAVLQGVFDNLKAKVFELILPFAQKLIPIIQEKLPPIIDALIPKLESLTPVFEGVIWVISQLFDYITNNIDELSTLAVGIGIVAGAIAVCTSPITGIVIAIGALIAVLVQVIKYWDDWGKYVIFICPPLTLVMNLIMSIKRHWDSIVDGFKNGGILEGLKRIGLTLLDAVLSPIQNLLEMIAEIPGIDFVLPVDFALNGVQKLRDKINEALPDPEKTEGKKEGEIGPSETQEELESTVKGGGAGGKGGLGKTTKDKTESVASGGTRNTQITINLDNMVETVNFNGGVEENAQRTTDTFGECLLRALYSAQTAV